MREERFDLDLLEDEDPFEIDAQAAHPFKHANLGIDDIHDVWVSDPLFYLDEKLSAYVPLTKEVYARITTPKARI